MRSQRDGNFSVSSAEKLANLVVNFPLEADDGYADLIASSLKESTTYEVGFILWHICDFVWLSMDGQIITH